MKTIWHLLCTAVASAAARMVGAAGERPLIEMGSRRTHERAAVAAARAANSRCNSGGVGDGMAGLDDRNYFGRPAIALARHGDTGDLPRSHA